MQLPAELVSLAVRGIDGQATINQLTIENTLRDCAIHSLQHQAGFIPQQDNHALYTACSHNTGQHIKPESLKHLNIILNSYPMMLQEWVQAMCSVEKAIPDEYIPYFLTLGCNDAQLRPWLKLIMSERAQWLIDHHANEKWNWYAGCDTGTVDELITAQNNANWKVAQIIHESLARETIGNGYHRGLAQLQEYHPMWRRRTAKLLIDAIFVSNVTASFDSKSQMVQVARLAAYQLPLNFADEFLATLRSGHDGWKTIADEIEETFTMRLDMLKTILEGNE